MPLTPAKRKKIEALVLDVMGTLDATGANAVTYKKQFAGMSAAQFEAWLKDMESDEDRHFYLDVQQFHNEPGLSQIEKAAKLVGVELHQYVYFNHEGEEYRSRNRVPVGWMHVRRLQQILAKKTSYSTEAQKRNPLTGQLSGGDAIGRVADEEAYALKTVGAEAVLREVLGPRADNRDKRLEMYHAVERDGFVRYADLKGDSRNQPGLNYMDTILLAAGLKSDLIDTTELLRVSADRPPEARK
jgi:hypothetical protein